MTKLEQQLAELLREWEEPGACACDADDRELCVHCRTREALAAYDEARTS